MTWTELKDYIRNKRILKFIEHPNKYDIWLSLNGQGRDLETEVFKTSPPNSDQTDFETNYKTFGNMSVLKDHEIRSVSTYHKDDTTIVEHTIYDDSETLYKTFNINDCYLKELVLEFDDKDVILYVYVDDIKVSDINLKTLYEVSMPDNTVDGGTGKYVTLYKNRRLYMTVKLSYDDSFVDTDIKVKLKYANSGSTDVRMGYSMAVYNKSY